MTRTLIKPGDARRMGSHLPLGDRQARLSGEERANIRPSEISGKIRGSNKFILTEYIFFDILVIRLLIDILINWLY